MKEYSAACRNTISGQWQLEINNTSYYYILSAKLKYLRQCTLTLKIRILKLLLLLHVFEQILFFRCSDANTDCRRRRSPNVFSIADINIKAHSLGKQNSQFIVVEIDLNILWKISNNFSCKVQNRRENDKTEIHSATNVFIVLTWPAKQTTDVQMI